MPGIQLELLTSLILKLNYLIDSRKCDQVTIEDAHKAIKEKRIIPFLKECAGDEADFSLHGMDGPYANSLGNYYEQMCNLSNVTCASDFGVENLGLCYLLALTNEIVQDGTGWHPNDR